MNPNLKCSLNNIINTTIKLIDHPSQIKLHRTMFPAFLISQRDIIELFTEKLLEDMSAANPQHFMYFLDFYEIEIEAQFIIRAVLWKIIMKYNCKNRYDLVLLLDFLLHFVPKNIQRYFKNKLTR